MKRERDTSSFLLTIFKNGILCYNVERRTITNRVHIRRKENGEAEKMKFTKMHGCGNDYVYVNCLDTEIENVGELAIRVSDRHFGIGSDGLILIEKSEVADFKMKMYNADGSEGSMCGNGIRCVGKFVYDKGLTNQTTLRIETKSGIKTLELHIVEEKVDTVTVDMGKATFEAKKVPVLTEKEEIIGEDIELFGQGYQMTCLSVGNPHAVLWVEDVKETDIVKLGEAVQKNPMFPEGVNVEFIHIVNRNTINMRVLERGSGETMACGTGACASVVAGIANGLLDEKVTVHLLGGDLTIQYQKEDGTIFMTGPATTVFEGEF